jgi:hypothetical protein
MQRLLGIATLVLILGLAACSQATPAAQPTTAPAAEPFSAATADLGAIKDYLLGQTQALTAATSDLQAASDRYYALAAEANFDYEALWNSQQEEVIATIEAARAAWIAASPAYEKADRLCAAVQADH